MIRTGSYPNRSSTQLKPSVGVFTRGTFNWHPYDPAAPAFDEVKQGCPGSSFYNQTGSYATVIAWQKSGTTWKQVYSTTHTRVGANGVTDGATRKQGTDTTPTGTYTITRGFGVGTNPGTKMPYHHLASDDRR